MVDVPSTGRRPKFNRDDTSDDSSLQGLDICPGVGLAHRPEIFESEGLIGSLIKTWGPIFEIWEGYAVDPVDDCPVGQFFLRHNVDLVGSVNEFGQLMANGTLQTI